VTNGQTVAPCVALQDRPRHVKAAPGCRTPNYGPIVAVVNISVIRLSSEASAKAGAFRVITFDSLRSLPSTRFACSLLRSTSYAAQAGSTTGQAVVKNREPLFTFVPFRLRDVSQFAVEPIAKHQLPIARPCVLRGKLSVTQNGFLLRPAGYAAQVDYRSMSAI